MFVFEFDVVIVVCCLYSSFSISLSPLSPSLESLVFVVVPVSFFFLHSSVSSSIVVFGDAVIAVIAVCLSSVVGFGVGFVDGDLHIKGYGAIIA